MSKESDAVKTANDALQADANAAKSTKDYGAATTTWVGKQDPFTVTPPTPTPGDWRELCGFATGDIYQNPQDYASVGLGGKAQSLFPSLIKEAKGRLIRTSWYGASHDDELNLAMSYGLKCVVTFQPIESIPDASVVGCVTRFKGKVPYYELGNEPNLHNINGVAYAQRFNHYAPLIHQADPAAKILSGGLWMGGAGNPDAYCKALIDTGAFNNDYVYGFGIHYPDDGGMAPYVTKCRQMLDAAGLQRIKIVATECCPKNATEQSQSDRCQKILDWVKNGTLGLATCFSILPDYDRPYQFVEGNGTKRKAFYTFQTAMGA